MPHSGVQLLLDRSGSVTAFCGAAEVGQGSDNVLAALVAEVLGIDILDVKVVTGDTALGPVDLGSYSSRVTLMMGNAAVEAAQRARDRLADAAGVRPPPRRPALGGRPGLGARAPGKRGFFPAAPPGRPGKGGGGGGNRRLSAP